MSQHVIPVGGVAPTAIQTLYQLQDMTRRTGILHELQTRHLKVWAMAALNVDKVELRYSREPEVCEFRTGTAVLHGGKPPDNLTKCLEYLDELVRFLLGTEYRVTVVWDDDAIWDRLSTRECQTKPQQLDPNISTSPNEKS